VTAQGLEVIDRTVQVTHEWINELAARLGWVDRRQVLHLLRATLTALRDWLPPEEAADLAAQLPILLRGMFWEGWRPATTPVGDRHRDAFLARITAQLADDLEFRGPEDLIAVFRLLEHRISEGEIRDVRGALPEDVRGLWPEG
jgi:uncharacterized protein (DUF2267 family)